MLENNHSILPSVKVLCGYIIFIMLFYFTKILGKPKTKKKKKIPTIKQRAKEMIKCGLLWIM